jgi:phosphomannomutase
MKSPLSLKISISGVRGVVGDSLTPQLAGRFAAAFGTYAGRGKVIVGRDARPSGEMLENAVFAGLLAVGCQPVAIGVCPIPSVLLLTKELRAQGGVVVTASHNPREWNGLKFLSGRGLYLSATEVAEFLDIYHQGEFSLVRADRHRPPLEESGATRHHLARLLKSLDVDRIRRERFRVVADCANGAGAVLMPEFLEALGCQATLLNARPDGTFAHQSEPVPENLAGLCRAVREAGADVGFAQDADADRLAVIDEKGEALGEEMTLALAVRFVLSKTPGPVVVNLSTTQAIDDLAREAGVPVFRTKIGESNVVEEMLARRAVIGGEGNGGVVWPVVHPCRDSFAAAGLVLEQMAASGKAVSKLRREIPSYVMVKDKVPGTPEQAHRMLGQMRKECAAEVISTLDGLKIGSGRAAVHIRPSNTEPIIRVQAEARNRKDAANALGRIKRRMAALLG